MNTDMHVSCLRSRGDVKMHGRDTLLWNLIILGQEIRYLAREFNANWLLKMG